MSKRTYVLIHGGGHGGSCCQRVAPLLSADGHDVYAPMLTGVADRVPDRIGHLVYLDGAVPADGESLAALWKPFMDRYLAAMRTVDGVDLVMFPSVELAHSMGITESDDVKWLVERLTPHPWKTIAQPLRLTNEAALRLIPQTHIVCTSMLRNLDVDLIREVSHNRLWDIDTGHDLMITEPGKTAELLLRVATV